jgi:hypothetical protein
MSDYDDYSGSFELDESVEEMAESVDTSRKFGYSESGVNKSVASVASELPEKSVNHDMSIATEKSVAYSFDGFEEESMAGARWVRVSHVHSILIVLLLFAA